MFKLKAAFRALAEKNTAAAESRKQQKILLQFLDERMKEIEEIIPRKFDADTTRGWWGVDNHSGIDTSIISKEDFKAINNKVLKMHEVCLAHDVYLDIGGFADQTNRLGIHIPNDGGWMRWQHVYVNISCKRSYEEKNHPLYPDRFSQARKPSISPSEKSFQAI